MAYLELCGVGKGFPRGKGGAEAKILRDVHLAVEEGEFVCVIGRSGSGKTTLISLVAGLIEPDAGEIRLDGRPIDGPGPDRGVVFQGYSLLPWMTVFENVCLGVEAAAPGLSAREIKERTDYFIRLVNLSGWRSRADWL